MVTETSKGRDSTVPVFVGLSTDTKPTDVDNGSEFREFDTGKIYYFDAENVEWCEQPGEGGGGGGSDFSSAQVTIINNANKTVDFHAPIALEEDEYDDDCPALCFASNGFVDGVNTSVLKVALYKGAGLIVLGSVDASELTLTGGIVPIYEGALEYLVTGDCTITVS